MSSRPTQAQLAEGYAQLFERWAKRLREGTLTPNEIVHRVRSVGQRVERELVLPGLARAATQYDLQTIDPHVK